MRFEQAKDLLDAFSREGAQYVLVGSMAMAAHGIVRATEDIEAETIDIDGTPVVVANAEHALCHEARHDSPAGPGRRRRLARAVRPGGMMMPVQKRRDISEQFDAPAPRSAAENLRSAFDLAELARRLSRKQTARGVQRQSAHDRTR